MPYEKLTEKFIEKRIAKEDIWDRKEIKAPADYVSVYHETKTEFLPLINEKGLEKTENNKGLSSAKNVERLNNKLDQFRPEKLKAIGVSRSSNIFAYPYLEYGSGLGGATKRYMKRSKEELRDQFEALQKYSNEFLQKEGIMTFEDFLKEYTDPQRLRQHYPGEVLELKVNPKKCFVGDLEYFTQLVELIRNRNWPEDEAVEYMAKKYWGNLITLEDFLKWYKKPEWDERGEEIKDKDQYEEEPYTPFGFWLLKGAPENFPKTIDCPEILIPGKIPQEYIRVLE